jgi:cold shock CspA family protein
MRAVPGPRRGTVVTFDDAAGYGEVEDADGARVWFHCTAIADGSRSVPVGTAVRFVVVPGHLGRWEAGAITPAASD